MNRYFIYAGLLSVGLHFSGNVLADESTISSGPTTSSHTQLSIEDMENAQPRMPMLTDPSQLPAKVRGALGINNGDGVASTAYGTGKHPFTTKRATTQDAAKGTIKRWPYRGTGKLFMRFGSSWYVCTASVIDKGLLVTAAHCVHDYGQQGAGWADEIQFQPALHSSSIPFGTWNAINWIIPTVYYNGTDVCTATGIVCENDVAIVVVETDPSTGNYIKQAIGNKEYSHRSNNYSYTSFLGEKAAQITQLGYPAAMDSGYRMIRTDSLGYQDAPSNVIIGSDQTGGSSGGPWFVNFGINYSSTSSTPSHAAMAVMAVTSWGYVDNDIKIQGASRFAKNTNFTSQSNIDALISDICGIHPDHCD